MTNAGFAQLRMTPDLLPHAHIAAGFRYNSPTTGRSATIWNVVGRYDLPFNLYARGEVGTNFRLPTAEELFADDPQDERGNPNLKPERSLSANFSLGQRLQSGRFGIHWDLTGFVRRIDNLIDYTTFDEKTGQEVFGNENGTAHVNGVSISGEWNSTIVFHGTPPLHGTTPARITGCKWCRFPAASLKPVWITTQRICLLG